MHVATIKNASFILLVTENTTEISPLKVRKKNSSLCMEVVAKT